MNPTISIITATYNRSNILRYSIESVLNSSFQDWELIIVGDACTDDTEELVAAFNDSRIRFINLEENIGEQSGPNNIGFKISTGKYIAYLNHDDIFFPDHLTSSLAMMNETGADLVYSAMVAINPVQIQAGEGRYRSIPDRIELEFTPRAYVPASSWLLKRGLIESIGPWKSAYECYKESSQEFLFRAWISNKKLLFKPLITVMVIQSGCRKDSYKNRDYLENEEAWNLIKNYPDFRQDVLSSIMKYQSIKGQRALSLYNLICIKGEDLIYACCFFVKINPKNIKNMLFRRKGEFIRMLRKNRGLD